MWHEIFAAVYSIRGLPMFFFVITNFREFGSSTSPLGANFHDWNDWYKAKKILSCLFHLTFL